MHSTKDIKLRKVAHVMRRFTPHKWGGTESVVFNICRQLSAQGIENKVFCTDIFSEPGIEIISGVPVHRHRFVFPWLFLSDDAKRQMLLKGGSPLSFSLFYSLMREPDLSLIHTHVQHRLGGIARTVARLRGIPYVVSIHGGWLTMPAEHSAAMQTPFKNHIEWGKAFGWALGARRTMKDADAILCVGQDEYSAVCEHFPNKPVHYLPNGVDIDTFARAEGTLFRREHGIADDEKVILCVSRIDYQKNQLLLVKAFAQYLQYQPHARLVLLGPVNVEDYHRKILDLSAELGISDRLIMIPGYEPGNPLLLSAYKAADVFVLPSKMEPFGIVILEAWAAGTPVIASRVGGIPGFVRDGHDALLFESDDVDGLVAQLLWLDRNPKVASDLIRNASTSVQGYSWQHVTERLCDIYQKVLAKS